MNTLSNVLKLDVWTLTSIVIPLVSNGRNQKDWGAREGNRSAQVIRSGRDTDKNRLYFGSLAVSQKAFSSMVSVLCFSSLVMVTIDEGCEGNYSSRDRKFRLSPLQIRTGQRGL